MPTRLQACAQMAEETAKQITASHESWTDFLKTAARFYKYPYPEQLMIFAQHPEATACAEYDLWNHTMRRWVKRGSRGIALIDASSDRPRLRYVFDVADTGETKNPAARSCGSSNRSMKRRFQRPSRKPSASPRKEISPISFRTSPSVSRRNMPTKIFTTSFTQLTEVF